MNPVETLAGIRTSLRQHVHSLPPTHRSVHLERHVLAREKERLEKELDLLERRSRQCRQHLADVQAELQALAERERAREVAVSSPAEPEGGERRFARMTVEY